jgi:branched-chain amino acid transport system permease protein
LISATSAPARAAVPDRWARLLPWAGWLVFAALLAVPLVVSSRYVVYLGTLLALQAGLATSLNLIIGIAGQFALSHAAFYGIGAYASALLIEHTGLGFWASLLPALAIAGVLAAAIGWPALRYTGGIHFALITFACGELLRLLAANWDDLTGGPQGKRLLYSPEPLLGIDFSSGQGMYVLAAALLLLTLGVVAAIRWSRFGRALVAIREDEVLAASLGIAVTRNKVAAFVASSILAALAGAVYAPFAGFISPEMMSTGESVAMVGMLIVGGIGTLGGPIVGTLIFFAVPEFLRVAKFYRLVILGVVIVVMVLFLPQGVVGLATKFRRRRRASVAEAS